MKQYFQALILLLALFMQTVSAQSVANPKVTYFHNDITGTAVAATDEKGEVIWREQRRAYGEIKVDPLKPKSLDEFSVGYTGHQADKESGLTYAKARYYNKAIGRFYAPDPIPFRESDLVSINRYAYAGNNPYKYVDPTGMEGEDLIKELRQARRGGKTAKEFEKDTNEFLKDSVKIAAVTGAEAGGGKFLGKFFSWLGSTKKASKPAKKAEKANPCSFKADTLVATPQGLKPIVELNEGDYVMSRDELTGQVTAKKITHKFVEWHDDDVRELTVSNGLIETVIITSDEHPFYVLGKGFIPASELKSSDQLVNLDFNVLKIISNKRIEQSMPMYNFEVADYHTYAVSEQNVWVHNDCFDTWNITEHTISVAHHNWNKIFGNGTKLSLDDVTPIIKEAINNGKWQVNKVLHGKGGEKIGEGLIIRTNVRGESIWVEATRFKDGKITVKNAGVD